MEYQLIQLDISKKCSNQCDMLPLDISKMKVLEHMIVYDKMVIVQHMVMKYSDNFWNMLYNQMRLECMVI